MNLGNPSLVNGPRQRLYTRLLFGFVPPLFHRSVITKTRQTDPRMDGMAQTVEMRIIAVPKSGLRYSKPMGLIK